MDMWDSPAGVVNGTSFPRAVGRARVFVAILGLVFLVAAVGCKPKTRDAGATEVPVVPVSHPVRRVVTDYVDFTGRTNAVDSVNIIARVTGYLRKPLFKEGSEVKEGETLFVVDPRPYQAQYDQAQSQVDLDEAQLDLARTTLTRYEALSKSTPGAVSEQALDQYKAAVAEAVARVVAQKKSLEVYKLNKEFTQVISPINGQVSRYYQTFGNLVNQDQTLLTTVVSLDPMYVYFDMDESTLLQIRTLISEGKITPPAEGDLTVMFGLQNENGFPHKATINFVNNQVNSTTGSITMRGIFPNPPLIPKSNASSAAGTKDPSAEKASAADKSPAAARASTPDVAKPARFVPRLFSPGMFVRVRLPIGQPHPALLIIDRAIQSDQGDKFVYVVDTETKEVQRRDITRGSLQPDGLRAVEGEIKPDDWIVVGSIQQVREKMVVKPEYLPQMPSLGGQAGAAPPAAGAKPAPSGSGKSKD